MLCTNCKTNTATFFYTQSINGNESSVALCPSCAAKKDVGSSMVSPLFNTFFENSRKSTKAKKCRLCAMTFSDILSMGKVGCTECYNTFKTELEDTIRSIHGSAKHVGTNYVYTAKTATKAEPSEEEILRSELAQAIEQENYEEAAILRDKIKTLKGEK